MLNYFILHLDQIQGISGPFQFQLFSNLCIIIWLKMDTIVFLHAIDFLQLEIIN